MLESKSSLSLKFRRLNHARIRGGKALLLRFARSLFDHGKFLSPEDSAANYLVIRLDGKLGDSVTSSGFLLALAARARRDNESVYILTDKGQKDFFNQLGDFKVVVSKKGTIGNLKTYLKLRKFAFRAILNTSHIMNARTVFLVSQLSAQKKVSFANYGYSLFSDHVEFDFLKTPVLARYQAAYKILTKEQGNFAYYLPNFSEAQVDVDRTIERAKIDDKKIVVINAFAGAKGRSFQFETVLKVIQKIKEKEQKIEIILIGNKGDMDILQVWLQQTPDAAFKIFPEITSLWQNIALLNRAQVVVTPDTAIVHLASALNKPLVAVYRPDLGEEKNAQVWAPLPSQNVRIVFSDKQFSRGELDINFVSVNSIATGVVDLLRSLP